MADAEESGCELAPDLTRTSGRGSAFAGLPSRKERTGNGSLAPLKHV